MSEWQPIETAPKDGTMVLLAFSNMSQVAIGGWVEADLPDNDCWRGCVSLYGMSDFIPPSFWMPLPAPPSLGSSGQ